MCNADPRVIADVVVRVLFLYARKWFGDFANSLTDENDNGKNGFDFVISLPRFGFDFVNRNQNGQEGERGDEVICFGVGKYCNRWGDEKRVFVFPSDVDGHGVKCLI